MSSSFGSSSSLNGSSSGGTKHSKMLTGQEFAPIVPVPPTTSNTNTTTSPPNREELLDKTLSKVMKIIESKELSHEEGLEVMRDSIQNWKEHINPGFLTYRKSVAEGQSFASIEWRDDPENPGGATVLDVFQNKYIDCLGGYGIYNVGHSHPAVMKAVKLQLDKQPLHSQELLDYLRGYCAQILSMTFPDMYTTKTTTTTTTTSATSATSTTTTTTTTPPAPAVGDDEDSSSSTTFHENALRYAFFTNSGTESVEACLKMAMLATGNRRHFVGLVGAFHGKTLGSLSGTSKSVFRSPFAGGLLPFTHIPVNDIQALKTVFASSKFTGSEIAGVLIEPILGEGGIHVCSDEFLRAARSLCDEYGAMLIFDEVQSGMGRTGKMWACEWSGVLPDLMAIGKAFGGGVVGAGAAVGNYKAWHKYFENPFLHTTTFGGNPLSMAAAISTMQVLRNEHLIEAAHEKGTYFKTKLESLCATHPKVMKEIRGRGLMLGIEFQDNDLGFTFSKGVFSKGVLLSGTLVNARTIRVEPPLTITYEEINTTLGIFASVLDGMEEKVGGGGGGGVSVSAPSAVTAVVTAATVEAGVSASGAGAGALPATTTTATTTTFATSDYRHRLSLDSTTDPDPFEGGVIPAVVVGNTRRGGNGGGGGERHGNSATTGGAPTSSGALSSGSSSSSYSAASSSASLFTASAATTFASPSTSSSSSSVVIAVAGGEERASSASISPALPSDTSTASSGLLFSSSPPPSSSSSSSVLMIAAGSRIASPARSDDTEDAESHDDDDLEE